MKKFTYVISDPQGLHARNSMQLSKAAEGYESSVFVEGKGKTGNVKVVFNLLTLLARQGDSLTFVIEGPDEEDAAGYLESVMRTLL